MDTKINIIMAKMAGYKCMDLLIASKTAVYCAIRYFYSVGINIAYI